MISINSRVFINKFIIDGFPFLFPFQEHLGLKKPQRTMTQQQIMSWFMTAHEVITKSDPDLLNQPERIFHCSDAKFNFYGSVMKTPDDGGDRHMFQCAVVLACASAFGEIMHPLLIFKDQNFNFDPLDGFPEALFARSKSGLITCEIFKAWIETAFVSTVAHLPKPVVLFVDEDNLDIPVLEVCRDNGIIVYGIPGRSSGFVVPIELHLCADLKQAWKEEVHSIHPEPHHYLQKKDFACVFKRAWERGLSKEYVISGFRLAGIYPWKTQWSGDFAVCKFEPIDPSQSIPTDTKIGLSLGNMTDMVNSQSSDLILEETTECIVENNDDTDECLHVTISTTPSTSNTSYAIINGTSFPVTSNSYSHNGTQPIESHHKPTISSTCPNAQCIHNQPPVSPQEALIKLMFMCKKLDWDWERLVSFISLVNTENTFQDNDPEEQQFRFLFRLVRSAICQKDTSLTSKSDDLICSSNIQSGPFSHESKTLSQDNLKSEKLKAKISQLKDQVKKLEKQLAGKKRKTSEKCKTQTSKKRKK